MVAHSLMTRAVVCTLLWGGTMSCRRPHAPSHVDAGARVSAESAEQEEAITQPPDEDDLRCLLATDRGRVHLQFGYRGCFGGSDNDLDLDVGATASVSGHLWTGVTTNRAIDGVPLKRELGLAHLHLLADALSKPDEPSTDWTTTKAFVRVSYWCGTRRSGPFMLETNAPSEEDEKTFAGLWTNTKRARVPRHHPYSRVHATIAVARDILGSVPSKCGDSSAQVEDARRRLDSLYKDGMRVRHDPIETWRDP
jgi:hypothetical protein